MTDEQIACTYPVEGRICGRLAVTDPDEGPIRCAEHVLVEMPPIQPERKAKA